MVKKGQTMKVILRFLGAMTIATVSLTNINACSGFLVKPSIQDDTQSAVALGWYDSNNISKIKQKLHYNIETNMYEIITNPSIITNTKCVCVSFTGACIRLLYNKSLSSRILGCAPTPINDSFTPRLANGGINDIL